MVSGNIKILLVNACLTIYIVEELTLADLVPQSCENIRCRGLNPETLHPQYPVKNQCLHKGLSNLPGSKQKNLSFCSLRIIAFSIRAVLLQAYKAQEV